MKILVNVIEWKSACLLLILFSKVELEIESVIHEFRLSELLQFTTVFLGRTSETFRTVHETGDTVHLQNLILIRGCHVLQVIRDELRAHTILDQSDYLKREGDRRFTHLDHIANLDHAGRFADTYEEILQLKGIGNYTAGAISAFAYGIPKPAVDGNVLRVISRITGSYEDIMKQSVRKKIESALEQVIPTDAASDFNQGLIELGAIVCVPNGGPKCEQCPVKEYCIAHAENLTAEIPVKKKAKARKIEERTVLIFKDGKQIAIRKRPAKGLLAGLYEFPNLEGKFSMAEVTEYSKKIGLMPVRIQELPEAKHIFSHIEWHMTGYEVTVDELEKTNEEGFLFIHPEQIKKEYSIPSAFEKYTEYAGIRSK